MSSRTSCYIRNGPDLDPGLYIGRKPLSDSGEVTFKGWMDLLG